MKDKKFKSIKEILENYDPVEGFREKHEANSDAEFIEYLNK